MTSSSPDHLPVLMEEQEEDNITNSDQTQGTKTKGIKSYLHLLYDDHQPTEGHQQQHSYEFVNNSFSFSSRRRPFISRLVTLLFRTVIILCIALLIVSVIMISVGVFFPRKPLIVDKKTNHLISMVDPKAVDLNHRLHLMKVWGFALLSVSGCLLTLMLVLPSLLWIKKAREDQEEENSLLISSSSSSSSRTSKNRSDNKMIPVSRTIDEVQPNE